MKFLAQHLSHPVGAFNSVQTELANPKVTGQTKDRFLSGTNRLSAKLMIPNTDHILVRNFLTKAENGTVSIHQLTAFQMPTFGSNAQYLTAFVSTSMSERKGENPYSGATTFYDGNYGTIQRILDLKAYNCIESSDFSISHEYIPFAASKWDNVNDNQAVFIIFNGIQKAAENGDTDEIQSLWDRYEKRVEAQIAKGKLVKSAILIAGQNSLSASMYPFVNTVSGNPAYHHSNIYGVEKYKNSFVPRTSILTATVRKTTKDFVNATDDLKGLVKPNFVFGLRNSKTSKVSQATKEVSDDTNSEAFYDPASDIDDSVSSIEAVYDAKKLQSYSSLLTILDSNGRMSVLQGIIQDVSNNGRIIKRSNTFQDLGNVSEMFVSRSVIIPRSLNSGISNGVVGITDNGMYGSLGIVFEATDISYQGINSSTGITSNVVDIDVSDLSLLDALDVSTEVLVSIDGTDEVEVGIVDTGVGVTSSTVSINKDEF